jgi:hypothetical protein
MDKPLKSIFTNKWGKNFFDQSWQPLDISAFGPNNGGSVGLVR